jgi:hypothetical protein
MIANVNLALKCMVCHKVFKPVLHMVLVGAVRDRHKACKVWLRLIDVVAIADVTLHSHHRKVLHAVLVYQIPPIHMPVSAVPCPLVPAFACCRYSLLFQH